MRNSHRKPAQGRRRFERLPLSKISFLVSAALLLFAYGVAVGRYQIFPYSVIKFGQDSVEQVFEERETITETRPVEHLFAARDNGSGAVIIDESRMSPGLTFMSGFFDQGLEMRLIRADGSIVHRWPARFHDIFPHPSHIKPKERVPQSNWNTGIHGALAFPDGSVLFNFEGSGLAKLDRCGAIEWTLPRMTHHSVKQSQGGGFWVPSRHYIDGISRFREITPPYEEDTVINVSQDGKVLLEISVLELLFENNLRALLFANGSNGIVMTGRQADPDDLTHLNYVEELSPDMAAHFPNFAAGDLLISLRNLNLIMVVDPLARRIKWRRTGPWMDQHDPHFMNTGRISVFSNNNDGTDDGSRLGGSTIIEADPVSGQTSVRYGGRPDQMMYTKIRGTHQRLANGNTLIAESHAGRVFEISEAGDIVWKYTNRYDDTSVALVIDAIRYPPGYFNVIKWACPKR